MRNNIFVNLYQKFSVSRGGHYRDVQKALREMEARLSQGFDNLQIAVDEAVVSINGAIDVLLNHTHPGADDPVALQAMADKLNAAKAALDAAVATPVP